jgi:hypothetical protein
MTDAECVQLLQWCLPRLNMQWRGFWKVRRIVRRRIEHRLAELDLPDAASTGAAAALAPARRGSGRAGLLEKMGRAGHDLEARFDALSETRAPRGQETRACGSPSLTRRRQFVGIPGTGVVARG